MFNNSSSYLEFGSATLNSIHGNQQNNTYYLQHQNQVVPAPAVGKEWTVKMRQQFDWVPPGKINMMKIVSLQGVPRGQYEDNPDRLEDEERSDMTRAYRVAHLACLVEGTRESSPFLCVAYTGRDAQKLFKRDCLAFSRFRHANVMQLRGFSDSGTPMTLFHEELIPVHHVLRQHRDSSLPLRCYFSLLASMAVTTMQEWCQAELDSYLCNNVWIQPKSGRISLGLDGPWPEISFPVMFDHSHQLQSCSSDMPVLSTGMYNAGDVLNYLLLFSPDEFFLQRLTYLRPSHIFRCEEGCSLPTSQVWARSSGQPIAKFESRWTYYACNFWNQDNLQPTVMADGRTRLSVSSVPHPKDWQRDLPGYRYYRDPMSPDRYLSWLTQAFSFFNALNIRRSKWPDCAMIHSINLDLIPTTFDFSVPAGSSIKFEPPCYLFLTAPPQFPDSTPDLYTWMLGKDLYYWSSDPEGHSIMPESQRESLGLPSFIPDAWAEYYTWDSDMYDVICAWQEKKNFDPTTTDFTASLGYPIFQHISSDMDADKGRFKVLPDDADSSYSAREVTMDVDLPSQPQMEIDMGTNMVVD